MSRQESPGFFTSYGLALWWTGMLFASIGTEIWPVTTEGRVLSALLSLYGLAVFGYITASFASFFVGRDAAAPEGEIAGALELDLLRQEIAALRDTLRRAESAEGAPEADATRCHAHWGMMPNSTPVLSCNANRSTKVGASLVIALDLTWALLRRKEVMPQAQR